MHCHVVLKIQRLRKIAFNLEKRIQEQEKLLMIKESNGDLRAELEPIDSSVQLLPLKEEMC